jgi:hypothetical protein
MIAPCSVFLGRKMRPQSLVLLLVSRNMKPPGTWRVAAHLLVEALGGDPGDGAD